MNIKKLAWKYDDLKKKGKKHSELQITDNKSIIIDGCGDVLIYDDEYIRLRLNGMLLEIFGFGFKMSNFSEDGLIVRGDISSINMIKGE